MVIKMNTDVEIAALKTRVKNLEEVVKKLLTLYSNFSSNKEVQELTTVFSTELQEMKANVDSLTNRVEILEDVPDIDF